MIVQLLKTVEIIIANFNSTVISEVKDFQKVAKKNISACMQNSLVIFTSYESMLSLTTK